MAGGVGEAVGVRVSVGEGVTVAEGIGEELAVLVEVAVGGAVGVCVGVFAAASFLRRVSIRSGRLFRQPSAPHLRLR